MIIDLDLVRMRKQISCRLVQFPLDFRPGNAAADEDKHLILEYLELRKRVFTDKKKWDVWLPFDNDLDQYDQHDAYYVIAFEAVSQKVVGGARWLPTNRGGPAPDDRTLTYMIRDAGRGCLSGLPTDLCADVPPCDPDIWELTRFVTDRTPNVGRLVLETSREFLQSKRARGFVFLGPPAFRRMARSMDFTPVPLGEVSGNMDGRFQVLYCEL